MLDKDAAKGQVSKTAADVMEWSQRTGEPGSWSWSAAKSVIGCRQMGIATEEEVNALRKRVRDLAQHRPCHGARGGKKTSGGAETAAKATARKPARCQARGLKKTDTTGRDAAPARRNSCGAGWRTRAEAREAVEAGIVQVAGVVASKPATMVADDAAIALLGASRPFVSRAGSKLDAALERFAIDPTGWRCGCGGVDRWVSDALLQRGAEASRGGGRRLRRWPGSFAPTLA